MESPPEGYRKNVGICLTNREKKVFGARRLDIHDAWQMPQVTAMRELREETGVVSAELTAEVPFWLTDDFPPDVQEKLAIRWGKKWKGQAQKWFLLKFTGKSEEVNLLGDGTEKPEFGDWVWMKPDTLIERAVDFKQSVHKQVISVSEAVSHSRTDENLEWSIPGGNLSLTKLSVMLNSTQFERSSLLSLIELEGY